MKRKKWSELEEQTLLTKYSELSASGVLSKLKTREKKFKPIADHVNSVHHLQDPTRFPFKWSWRDVSIKVQNMRHQYLGVKQKIRLSDGHFNWDDGENHWENFLKYKEVFGDVELEIKGKKLSDAGVDFLGGSVFGSSDELGLGFGLDCDDLDDDDDGDDDAEEETHDDYDDNDGGRCLGGNGDLVDRGHGVDGDRFGNEADSRNRKVNAGSVILGSRKSKLKRKLGILGAQVLDLRDVIVRREERRSEREFNREKSLMDREEKRRESEFIKKLQRTDRMERLEDWEFELEKRELVWARREIERRSRLEREFDEERRRRMRVEERREEEEMEWRERMIELQIEHEKLMMQMHADACQNQMQILGVMARMLCQFFGSASDALSGALSGLHPQVLQNLQNPAGLDDNGKPETNSPSEFL